MTGGPFIPRLLIRGPFQWGSRHPTTPNADPLGTQTQYNFRWWWVFMCWWGLYCCSQGVSGCSAGGYHCINICRSEWLCILLRYFANNSTSSVLYTVVIIIGYSCIWYDQYFELCGVTVVLWWKLTVVLYCTVLVLYRPLTFLGFYCMYLPTCKVHLNPMFRCGWYLCSVSQFVVGKDLPYYIQGSVHYYIYSSTLTISCDWKCTSQAKIWNSRPAKACSTCHTTSNNVQTKLLMNISSLDLYTVKGGSGGNVTSVGKRQMCGRINLPHREGAHRLNWTNVAATSAWIGQITLT